MDGSNSATTLRAPPQDTQWFEHEPLDQTCRQLRLFQFTGRENAEVACELATFDLDKAVVPPYQALSYTWGPPQPLHPVLVNGKSFLVRSNLFDFMEIAQRRLVGVWIWVDQLCINQHLVTERNHQVSIMAEIYSKAWRVIVWLGREEHHASIIASYLTDRSYVYQNAVYLLEEKTRVYEQHGNAAFASFAGNAYWRRLWIVQEIKLAREIIIWYGDHIIPAAAWSSFKSYAGAFGNPFKGHQNLNTINWLLGPHTCNLEKGGSLFYLHEALDLYVQNDCVDPRDKIYGLLAIVRPRSKVEVNYDLDIEQVFRDAVAVISREPKIGGELIEDEDDMVERLKLIGKLHRVMLAKAAMQRDLAHCLRVQLAFLSQLGASSFITDPVRRSDWVLSCLDKFMNKS